MVLDKNEINDVLTRDKTWLVFLRELESWRSLGSRALPARA